MSFYIFHTHRVCLVERVDFICSLYTSWEGFGSSFYSPCLWVAIVVLFPPLHVGHPLWFAPVAALEDFGLPQGGPGVGVVAIWLAGVLAAPGTQGSWQLEQQEIKCSQRVRQPLLANTLQYSCWRTPRTEKPGRPQSTGLQSIGHD